MDSTPEGNEEPKPEGDGGLKILLVSEDGPPRWNEPGEEQAEGERGRATGRGFGTPSPRKAEGGAMPAAPDASE